jgi:hypothetical protein
LDQAVQTRLFQSAGQELKCLIDRPFSEEEIRNILAWCEEVASAIVKYGLKE